MGTLSLYSVSRGSYSPKEIGSSFRGGRPANSLWLSGEPWRGVGTPPAFVADNQTDDEEDEGEEEEEKSAKGRYP